MPFYDKKMKTSPARSKKSSVASRKKSLIPPTGSYMDGLLDDGNIQVKELIELKNRDFLHAPEGMYNDEERVHLTEAAEWIDDHTRIHEMGSGKALYKNQLYFPYIVSVKMGDTVYLINTDSEQLAQCQFWE
jgi:hypothetical protein